MEKAEYRKQAKGLIDCVANLQRQVLEKHTASILEQMHFELSLRDSQIERLKKCQETTIAWLHTELGTAAVNKLLEILNDDTPNMELRGGESHPA